MKLCIVIPNYNHGDKIAAVVDSLSFLNLAIIIVDDGSDLPTQQKIAAVAQQYADVEVVTHAVNQGKGGAVMTGMKKASELGFSHMLQVDADGQHDISNCEKLIELAKTHPQQIISGLPIYDDSIPLGRRFSRHITHFWVWVETLSFSIKDTMCGFRIYPLPPCIELMARQPLGTRMDFDIEVMVRLYWSGTSTRFLPTKVIYPEDGISHFQPVADNVRITWMHTRLFFGMLTRIPSLLKRQGDSS
ncbi:MAG: glycosyltransferase involved in cell wall biosynthesis [Phenylobacterium sp.]|jgi:glycosyltransferase involved in cell wall biosynthesis